MSEPGHIGKAVTCPACGTQIARTLLSCPSCHQLVFADRLKTLAQAAEAAAASGDTTRASELWREAQELLPIESRQHRVVQDKLDVLTAQKTASKSDSGKPRSDTNDKPFWKKGGLIAAAALLLWKLKFVVIFVVTKGKLLLLGLTKWSTLLSMLLSMGVYWAVWGWKFAAGLVISIYIHEMGHVAALRHYGFKADAPMFIPGLGAVIRLRQRVTDPREDARIGLAGPIWGLGAAVVAYGVSVATGLLAWAAIAKVGAWINLFNLMPVWQLDGGRGFNAMNRGQRWTAVAVVAGALLITQEGMLILLLITGIGRALTGKGNERGDYTACVVYCALVVVLSVMCKIPVPIEALVTVPGESG